MQAQDTKIIQDWLNACVERSSEGMDRVMTPDYVHHDPQPPPDAQTSREAFKQGIFGFVSAFGNLRINVDEAFSEGDKIAARWTFSGTHQAEFMGAAPTSKSVSFTSISTHRIA